jgi:hypothetical protein
MVKRLGWHAVQPSSYVSLLRLILSRMVELWRRYLEIVKEMPVVMGIS